MSLNKDLNVLKEIAYVIITVFCSMLQNQATLKELITMIMSHFYRLSLFSDSMVLSIKDLSKSYRKCKKKAIYIKNLKC